MFADRVASSFGEECRSDGGEDRLAGNTHMQSGQIVIGVERADELALRCMGWRPRGRTRSALRSGHCPVGSEPTTFFLASPPLVSRRWVRCGPASVPLLTTIAATD